MRFITRFGLVFGVILVGLVATLAYARRDEPPDWIVFSVKQKYGLGYDYYAVLSDGTHTRFLASTTDQIATISPIAEFPGWLEMNDAYLGESRLELIHMTGRRQLVLQGNYVWPTFYDIDHARQVAYMNLDTTALSDIDTWQNAKVVVSHINLTTNERASYELPFSFGNLRAEFGDGRFVYWSNYASGGDLYRVTLGTSLQIKPLTTRGDVLADYAPVTRIGWLYYVVDDGNADPYRTLYRMRLDGTHAELVTEGLLNIPNAMSFYPSDGDWIYYWGGAMEHPHLIQARPDGSDPIDLPVSVLYGWVRAWSADHQWVYYTEISPDFAVPASEGGNLRRVNLRTGENSYVWEMSNVQGMVWSADQQWLLLVTTEQNGYMGLHQIRPDGTGDTLLNDELSGYLNQLSDPSLAVFDTWGEVGKEIHLLDLTTLEIRPLHDDAPPNRIRQIVTTLPMPNTDAPLDWLVGIGAMALGVGLVGAFWRRA